MQSNELLQSLKLKQEALKSLLSQKDRLEAFVLKNMEELNQLSERELTLKKKNNGFVIS